ncbi:F-type H+-transporting ATPase subunit gamma [Nitrosospira briensis]|uniref:F-type H+-transporting ATPase subunit gamma n=1 Tax=Nitrosospira briensis TaxID=35799 RepID=A0A1I4YRC1_9PROT|nr:F0F1 ATP synthase subunit gamma [Nitrosospira briensis]SFN40189.1 F-type H+-transporting ATPase subunit gamma [Nitrosospira briensis]
MSDTLANLRQKIERARDLRSVVSTMKALAAVSIGQYEKSVRSLDEYYHAVELGLSVCLSTKAPSADVADVVTVPGEWKVKKDTGVTGAVVFGSDQGLVGQFNDVLADYAVHTLATIPGKTKVWAVGERVHDRLADRSVPLAGCLTVPFSIKAITPLVGQILAQIILPGLEGREERKESGGRESRARRGQAEQGEGKNGLQTLYLFYNSSRSGEIYEPVDQQLLPLDETWRSTLAKLPWPTKNLPEVVGSGPETLRTLVREYLFVSLFRACAESLASENASRLAAMERAERNIDQLSEDLRKTFYRLRQSKIDEELFDVLAGVEALKGPEQQKGRTRG